MKKLILIWLGVMGMIGGGYGQTTYYWRSEAVNVNWNIINNWWNGIGTQIPVGNEILTFDNTNLLITNNNLINTNRYRIIFGSNSTLNRTLNGSTPNIFYDYSGNTPAIINNSTGTHTINFPFLNGNVSGDNRLEINAANGNLVIGSTISGTGAQNKVIATIANTSRTISFSGVISNGSTLLSVKKEGAGIANFSGANTYTGGTTISEGTLRISGGNDRLPITGSVALSDFSGASFDLNNLNQTIGSLSGGGINGGNISLGSGTLTINTIANTTFSGVISGTGGLTKSGTGTITLSGVNTFSGNTRIMDGTIQLGAANIINNSSSLLLNGGTFKTGASAGFNETMGSLNLNSNSTIALGTGSHSLIFSASNAVTWAGSQLTISGWAGSYNGTAGTGGKIYVGNSASGLTAGQLEKITFFNGTSYFAATQLSDGEVVPTAIISPTIILSGVLPQFGSLCTNIQSGNYSYTVSGTNLTANIVINAPIGYQISLSAGSGFGSSLSLIPLSGTVNSTTIFVYFAPGSAGDFNSNITHTSTGAIQRDQSLFGTGLITPGNAGAITSEILSAQTSTVYEGENRRYSLIGVSNADLYEWTGFGFSPPTQTFANQITFVLPCGISSGTVAVVPLNNNGCRGASSPIFPVTINPIGTAIFSAGPSSVCAGATTKHTIFIVPGALNYSWVVSNGTFAPNPDPGVNRSAIDVTWNATLTNLSSTIEVTPRINACSGPATTFNVNVSAPSLGGTVNASTVCLGGTSTLSLTGQTGSVYQWQRSNDNSTFTNISGATGNTYTTPPVSYTNYYRSTVTNGVCAPTSSTPVTVPISQANISNAGSATYNTNWSNGQNDATAGFGAWALTSTGAGGFFTGTSDVNNDNTRSWGMYAGGTGAGNAANAIRPVFMGVGNTLAFSMDNSGIAAGNTIGFSLRNASNQSLMEFVFVGGATNYTLNDGTGTGFSTGVAYTTSGLDIRITYSGLNTYGISITPKGGTTTIITNRNFTAQAGGQVPAEIRMFNTGAGNGGSFDLFFNSLGINNPVITTQPLATSQSICVGGSVTALTIAASGTGNTFQWYSNTVNNTYAGASNLGSGSGAQTVSYTPQNSASGTLYYFCVVTGPCGTTYTRYSGSVTIGAPSTPGAITQANPGGTAVCTGASGVNYSITAVPGATAYNWTVPPGASITTGGGTNSITVNWSTAVSGNITVNAQNGVCATSPLSTLAITVNSIPGAPFAATPQAFCGLETVADLSATGTAIQWYSASTGGTVLPPTTSLVNGTTYHASQSVSGCESPRTPVVVNLIAIGTYVGPNNGDWNNAANWCGGVPTNLTNAIIPSGLTVNIGTANAIANSVTINGGLSFSGSSSFSLSISANGILTNNGTFTRGIGSVSFAGAGTVNGANPITFYNLTLNTGDLTFSTRPTIDGSFRINGGNLANGTNAPIYTTNSTLNYGITYTRFLEWSATGIGTIGTTPGFPNHVVIDAGTFTVLNSDAGTARALAGNLTVNSGATFTTGNLNAVLTVGGNMITNGTGTINLAGTNAAMAVVGSVTTNGTLTLSSTPGGNLNVGSNFTNNGVFANNGRTVTFNGATAQFISGNSTFTGIINANTVGIVSVAALTTIEITGTGTFNTVGTIFRVDGTLRNSGGTITGTATRLLFSANATYEHNFTTSNGTVPSAGWNINSNCSIIGYQNPTPPFSPAGMGGSQNFGNVIWNTPSMSTSPNLSADITILGTFSIQSTGSSEIRLASSGTRIISTNNFSQSGGILNLTDGSATSTINITGSFSHIGGTIRSSGTSLNASLQFNGTANQALNFAGTISGNVNYVFNNSNGFNLTGTVAVGANCTVTLTAGNFSDAGIFSYSTTNSTLIFNGSSPIGTSNYEFPASGGPVNLIINNSPGGSVTLHAPRILPSSGILTLSNGILATTATNLLTLKNTAIGAVTGGSASTHVSGPLARALISGLSYTYPVGKAGRYLPVGFTDVTGSSPEVRFEAFSPGVAGTIDANTLVSTNSNAEYWQGVTAGGTLTAGTISLTRTEGLSGTTSIARSSAAAGTYFNIGSSGTSGNTINGGITNGILGFFALAVPQTVYYRSNAITMNWQDAGNWEASQSPTFTSPFTPGLPPTSTNSDIIIIRNGHTVTVNNATGAVALDQMEIQTGGTLNYNGGTITVYNGPGEDIVIDNGGVFTHTASLTAPVLQTNATWRVKTGGMIHVNTNTPGSEGDFYASNQNTDYANGMIWENASIFNWQSTSTLSSNGLTYFLNAGSDQNIIPIFRLSSSVSLAAGANAPTVINGLFEANGDISWQNTGTKIFRNGIIGSGNVTQSSTSGSFLINGTTSRLGGTGAIIINATNGLVDISNGTCTLESNKTITSASGGRIRLSSAASTFNAQTFALSGTAGYEHTVTGSTLITANAAGVNGSIGSLSGAKSFVNGVNYTFNGITDQATGTLMGTTAGTITINNTGVTNNTVTLSNTGTNTANLTLTEGRFATGAAGNELRILNGGTVNATAGDFETGAVAGTISFLGAATVNASNILNFWNVDLPAGSGGVDFGLNGSPTINNQLQINNGRFVNTNAPFYASTSTLVYNAGNSFDASAEWYAAQNTGKGAPHHVQIGTSGVNNTILRFTGSTYRQMNGSLTIGMGAATGQGIDFSGTTAGGDLRLQGNWTLNTGASFNTGNREVEFNGSAAQSINGPQSATFAFLRINNNTGVNLTTNLTAGTLTLQNGVLTPGSGRVLTINNTQGGNKAIISTGGTIANGSAGGTVAFPEGGTITSSAPFNLYDVTAGPAAILQSLDFYGSGTVSSTITNSLTINSNINVTSAPFYAANSTLIYNTGGFYNRVVEWGASSGPGFPHHVRIQGGTTLNANMAALLIPNLPMGGNLELGGTGSIGNFNFNDGTKRLVVGGNVTIGSNAGTSTLTLGGISGSDAGDIEIRGSYTRTANGTINFGSGNGRAIYFTGSTNATISSPTPITIETFPYVIVDKATSANNTLTLAAPINISYKFTLSSGRVITDDINILSITNDAPDDDDNGVAVADYNNNPGYVDGPMIRKIKNTIDGQSYLFPVGKFAGSNHNYKRFKMQDIANSAMASEFKGEYKREQPPGTGIYFFQTNLFGILADEFWNVNLESGSAIGRLILPYFYSTTPALWLDVNKAPATIPTNANVAIVRGSETPTPGNYNWDFTAPDSSSFANNEPLPQARYYATYGDIRSRLITSFSPFTLGFGFNNILPIKLLTFTATLQNGSGLLQWKIADATDLRQFEVEHSTDGQRFSKIGLILPNGGLSFSYLHKNLTAGTHYYRLRMVEKDGQASFSKTEIIQVGRQQTYITGLLQNPVIGGQAIVQVNSAVAQHAEAVLLDAIGRMLLRQKVQLMAGPNNVNLTVLPLPAGTYRILFRTQDGVEKVMPMMK